MVSMSIFRNYSVIFKQNLYFFIPYCIFLVFGLPLFLFIPKVDSLLWINRLQTDFLDSFFVAATFVGDGLFYIIIIFLLFLVKGKFVLTGLLAYTGSGLVIQIVKRIVNTPRPITVFKNPDVLHFVPGVQIYGFHSMPSGHSASAFSLFLLLALITKYKPFGVIFFIAATLVGISRIYLAQHFFIDVYFGSIIGVIITIIIYERIIYSDFRSSGKFMNFSVLNWMK
jgi:membrane-associated phospholipid phosphatase